MLTPSKLGRMFNLSRTAILYYESIGLLRPASRSASRYRQYSDEDARRLEQICTLRTAGMALKDIKRVIDLPTNALARALEDRLEELNCDVERLRNQQRFILGLLKTERARKRIGVMSKATWTSLLDAAGFSQADRARWHADFERQSPEQHRRFLEFLCLPDEEIEAIRERSRAAASKRRREQKGRLPLRLEVLKHAGHNVRQEQPDAINTLLTAFLSAAPAATAGTR